MNDIDFDELDRAVSSTFSSPTDSPATDAPAPAVAERSTETASRPAQAPAARRGGRFMDVVHPSSDMRTKNTDSSLPSALNTPSVKPQIDSAPKQDWPDPIDLANQNEAPAESPVPEISSESLEESPLDSPFVNGAKVEKRPLGGPVPASSLDEALAELNMSDESVNEPAPLEATPELTAETHADNTPPVQEDVEAEALGEAAFMEPEETPVPVETSETTVSDIPETAPSTANASIPQQYTEHAPVHDAQQSGSIYDTESYHQPLGHPDKKHGSWAIILWILGLVVLGGGLGAVAYFFLLPLL